MKRKTVSSSPDINENKEESSIALQEWEKDLRQCISTVAPKFISKKEFARELQSSFDAKTFKEILAQHPNLAEETILKSFYTDTLSQTRLLKLARFLSPTLDQTRDEIILLFMELIQFQDFFASSLDQQKQYIQQHQHLKTRISRLITYLGIWQKLLEAKQETPQETLIRTLTRNWCYGVPVNSQIWNLDWKDPRGSRLIDKFLLQEAKKGNQTWESLFPYQQTLLIPTLASLDKLVDLVENRYAKATNALDELAKINSEIKTPQDAIDFCNKNWHENHEVCSTLNRWYDVDCLQKFTPEQIHNPTSPYFKSWVQKEYPNEE